VQTFGLTASGESQPLPIAPPSRLSTAFKMKNIFYMRLSPIPFEGNANRFRRYGLLPFSAPGISGCIPLLPPPIAHVQGKNSRSSGILCIRNGGK
jgi:hypothetical protein